MDRGEGKPAAPGFVERAGTMRPAVFIAGLALFAVIVIFLIFGLYSGARRDVVERLFQQQQTLAEQAATGIDAYIDYYEQALRFLAGIEGVQGSSASGRETMKAFYKVQSENLASITRMDELGVILYAYPDESVAGRDISSQQHVRQLLLKKETVMSGVFQAVQGYRAVAMHVPVFSARGFAGSLAILIPFERIAARYIGDIGAGTGSYGVLLDRDGSQLFCSLPARIDKVIAEEARRDPAIEELLENLRAGQEGRASFAYDLAAGEPTPGRRYLAYYKRIPLGDFFWTVLAVAPEAEALGYMTRFRDRLAGLGAAIVLAFGSWGLALLFALIRDKAAKAELEKSNAALQTSLSTLREAQDQLVRSEKMAVIGQLAASIAHQVNTPLGAILSASSGLSETLATDLVATARYLADLGPEGAERFASLVEKASTAILAGRRGTVDRRRRFAAEDALAAEGVDDPQGAADDLADLGLLEDLPAVLPLISGTEGRALAAKVQRLMGALGAALTVRQAAAKASAVVAALRDYVRGDRSIDKELIDLPAEIDMLLAISVEGHRPDVHVSRNYGADTLVRGVPDVLGQVFLNVIDNAIEAVGQGGHIDISAEREGTQIIVRIADDGPGIAPEICERVFEPFFTTKPRGQGSGIGLDVAKRIVEEHGGSISFESRPGHTLFTIKLPAAEANPSEEAEPTPS